MIFRDKYGFPVDQTGDGGDSSCWAGLLALFGEDENLFPYVNWDFGNVTQRHPFQPPWNSKDNFSRDQLIRLLAGLWRRGNYGIVRKLFWAHFRRGFFCQNIERDWPGSIKYPWPHEFYKDSQYVNGVNSITKPLKFNFRTFKFEGTLAQNIPGVTYEKKNFDFADFLGPNDLWHFILCGRLWYLYWFAPLGYLFTFIAITLHGLFYKGNDESGVIAQAKVNGRFFVWYYKLVRRDHVKRLWTYFVENRNMGDLYARIVNGL